MSRIKTVGVSALLIACTAVCLIAPARAECVPAQFTFNWLLMQEMAGGHTIARHVGMTDLQLIQRLTHNPNLAAFGSYPSTVQPDPTYLRAQATITGAIANDRATINNWARSAPNGTRRAYTYSSANTIGRVATRNPIHITNTYSFRTVFQATGGGNCFLLTSSPVP